MRAFVKNKVFFMSVFFAVCFMIIGCGGVSVEPIKAKNIEWEKVSFDFKHPLLSLKTPKGFKKTEDLSPDVDTFIFDGKLSNVDIRYIVMIIKPSESELKATKPKELVRSISKAYEKKWNAKKIEGKEIKNYRGHIGFQANFLRPETRNTK